MTELSNFFATRPERAEAPRSFCPFRACCFLNFGSLPFLFLHVRIYESYSFMFESTKLKGRRSLMLLKQ